MTMSNQEGKTFNMKNLVEKTNQEVSKVGFHINKISKRVKYMEKLEGVVSLKEGKLC